MANLSTEQIRAFLPFKDGESYTGEEIYSATATLLMHCAALDESPTQYGFEFVDEGSTYRNNYYLWERFTPQYVLHIDAYDAQPNEDCGEPCSYRGTVFDRLKGKEYIRESERFDTVPQLVAWFNETLQLELKKEEKPHECQA